MNKTITIITHNGAFHSDEVFGVAVLHLAFNDSLKIIRTRDSEIIEKGDIVLDVGNIYDGNKNLFDHHQKGGAGERENGIPYASFGLVWKKYGEQICGSGRVAELIDKKLVQPIDADDNGINVHKLTEHKVVPYFFHDAHSAIKPTWKEGTDEDEIFMEAVKIAKTVLRREIIQAQDKLEAEKIVEKIYENTKDKRIIVLDRFYPTDDILRKYLEPLFVVFKSENKDWHLKTIKECRGPFKSRKDLPIEWAGKTGEELTKITGVKDAIFCHNKRFIAAAKSREGAIALAKLAVG